MKIAEFAVGRPVTVAMLTICLLVLGAVSLQRLPLEQLPSISASGIRVTATYQNTAPEEVERLITLPLEEVLATLQNVESISSSSSHNRSSVRVDFVAGTDMDLANMEVRERVDQVAGLLPEDLDLIRIWRWQSDQRATVYLSIAWRGAGDELADIVQKVVEPRLLRLEGVVDVTIGGIDEKQLIVHLDQERLDNHNVAIPALGWQLRSNNVNVSLGRVADAGSRYQVRAMGEFTEVEQIGGLPLVGRSLRLGDVGDVVYDYPEKRRFERLNGIDAVTVEVFKKPAANVIDVAADVRAVLRRIEADYGGQLEIEVVRDRAEDVLREVDNLTTAAILGSFLAIGIIFGFLRNIRSTLVIAISIPTAAFCVFTGMYGARELFGSTITLNMVSMVGLMLAVGMLVDPAVVVLESIFRKREEEGCGAVEAALRGSKEVGMAVVASSTTTMCVFIPFFFLSDGRMATWLRDAGVSICLAIAVSMVVSLSVIPLAASRLFRSEYRRFDSWLKVLALGVLVATAGWSVYSTGPAATVAWLGHWSVRVAATLAAMQWTTGLGMVLALVPVAVVWRCFHRDGMRESYARFLGWTLRHRSVTLLCTVVLLAAGVYLYTQIEQRGTPRTPERRVDITVETDRSFSLEQVADLYAEMERVILAAGDSLDVESLTTNFGQRSGRLTARLVDADDGRFTTMQASNAIRKRLPETTGVTYKVGRTRSWFGRTMGVEVELRGPDQEVLAVLSEEVGARLARIDGVVDIDNSMEEGDEEIVVRIDREQALSYGLSPQDVGGTIAGALGTRRTTSFKTRDREIDVVMQLAEEDRVDLEQLQNSRYQSRDGTPIQLATIASFQVREGPTSLQREDRMLTVTVFANTEDRMRAYRMTGEVEAAMAAMSLPSGYSWSLGRQARWMQRDVADSNFTLIFAVLLIYLIMAALFESLIHPFTIMLAIPFSLIGVALGLYLLDVPMDNNAMLGLLILFGIVVNNGIVLVDHINHFRREGMERHEAILRGGQNRMRPIMMTAFTTILNLMPLVLPMVFGTAEGFAKRWGPVGLVVVSGLVTSTMLTLFLAPTLYSLLDDMAGWWRRVLHEVRGG